MIKNTSVSPAFSAAAAENLYCEYLGKLAESLVFENKTGENQVYRFFETVQADSLINSGLVFENIAGQVFCYRYLHTVIKGKAGVTHTAEVIANQYNYILTHYQGKAREYMLLFLYQQWSNIYTPSVHVYIAKIAEEARSFTDKLIQKRIAKLQKKRLASTNELPVKVLNTVLYDTAHRALKLRDALAALRGKYVLIDNWATWCVPCVKEIVYTRQLLDSGLLKKDNIEILYLSLDRSFQAWQNYSTSNRQYMQHSYVYKSARNAFLRFLNILGIPRYTLISPEGKLVHADAPRPSSYKDILRLIE